LSAQGGGIATEDSPGVVKPDGTTIGITNGTISVNKATQTSLGAIKGSEDIEINSSGSAKINTNFEEAVELANIIAGEAITEVLGKVSKTIATTMNLNENAILKSMLSNQMENSTSKIPTSALVYALNQTVSTLNSNLTALSTCLTAGITTITANAGSKTITFGQPFASVPRILTTAHGRSLDTVLLGKVEDITVNGFKIYAVEQTVSGGTKTPNYDSTFEWFAISK